MGQTDCVDYTLQALREFSKPPHAMGLIHLVGASGTGKTFLASLVQRAFFAPCGGEFDLACRTRALLTRGRVKTQFDENAVDHACGMFYVDFLDTNTESEAKERLMGTLEAAMMELPHWGDDPAILFLDNFNRCTGACERLMAKTVMDQAYQLPSGVRRRLDRVLILVTSDLSEEGLKVDAGESRKIVLDRVLEVLRRVWGEGSVWHDHGRIVPFAMFSEHELLKIFERIVGNTENDIRSRFESAVSQELKNVRAKWTGHVRFSEQEQRLVLDAMHVEVSQSCARVFDRISARMRAVTKQPISVEDLLLRSNHYEKGKSGFWESAWFSARSIASKTIEKREYRQNVVFKSAPNPQLVIIEIEDM